MKNTLRLTYSVNSYEVDPLGAARLTTIANFLQETAYKHAHSLNLGYTHLNENNRAWILSRMRIRIFQYPAWDDQVIVETWPRGVDKLFALRDFRIYDTNNLVLAEATTCWLMVDSSNHRPLRIPHDIIKIQTRSDSVFSEIPGKISLPETIHIYETRMVRYSDLDVVGHVNNVKFIEWCTDLAGPEKFLENTVTDFSINFIGEALPGDQVEISSSEMADNIICISGKNSGSGKECFRAQMQLRKI
ncbi:MAG: acyl-ACP thioesterase domain-containing protein [Bacteroidales bacterium]